MKYQSILQNHLKIIIGEKLDSLNLACDMMLFSFGNYALHAQCLARIIYKNDILVTTTDYLNWDCQTDMNNDEWYFVNKYKSQIVGGVVQSVKVSALNDVKITLDNGIIIELFVENGYHHFAEESEQWVFFKHDDYSYPYIAVNSKTVDILKTDDRMDEIAFDNLKKTK